MTLKTRTFGSLYFRVMAIVMILLAVGGFSIYDILHIEQMPMPYPLLICHVVAMVGWFTLFIIQTQLVGSGNIRKHKKLGLLSIFLAIAILILGVSINYVTYSNGSDLIIVAGNFGAITNFTIAYFVGYFYRKRPEYHKRAMLLAGVAILAPALGRIVISMNLPEPTVFILYLTLIGTLIVYDVRKRKRPHKVSVILGLWLVIGLLGAFVIGTTEPWARFLTYMWGSIA